MGILSSFMHGDHDLILFAILSIVVLLFVFLFEKFVVSVKKVSYTVPIYELQNGFTERVRRDLGGVKVKDVSIQSVDGEQAKVVVTYRRK